ncbi:hypothetical protein [Massilia sp. DD77]|uniref:hypothetical protein n=1 Tax=Massilia sp. DD77 TaxID=3109349 RepID=UPI002FFEA329
MYKTMDSGVERDCTPEEIAEIDERRAQAARPVVPDRIPMLNAHLVLIDEGWMPELRAFLDTMPGPEGEKARAYFDKALTMARDHDLVLAIPAVLGKTEAEVDQLFIKAGALNV